jgi:hypothetical protein
MDAYHYRACRSGINQRLTVAKTTIISTTFGGVKNITYPRLVLVLIFVGLATAKPVNSSTSRLGVSFRRADRR